MMEMKFNWKWQHRALSTWLNIGERKVMLDKLPNRRTVKLIIGKGWRNLGRMSIVDMGANMFLFNF